MNSPGLVKYVLIFCVPLFNFTLNVIPVSVSDTESEYVFFPMSSLAEVIGKAVPTALLDTVVPSSAGRISSPS